LSLLKFEARHSSIHIEKVLLSAIANWEQKNPDIKLEDVELYVKTIFVDGGASVKRLRTAPQGRGYRIRKRSHHVTIVVDAIQAPANSAVLNEILNTETEGKQENNA
jgi:large subunit ribosomal protein L22